jgi:hypothetical protein
MIPDFDCKHCHACSGPIIWFKPEDILMRDYMKKHGIDYVVWSTEEFMKQGMRCPYQKNDRCSIYPVRPIVCRLQGNIPELPCPNNTQGYLSKQQLTIIKREFESLLREVDGIGVLYGTRHYTRSYGVFP